MKQAEDTFLDMDIKPSIDDESRYSYMQYYVRKCATHLIVLYSFDQNDLISSETLDTYLFEQHLVVVFAF